VSSPCANCSQFCACIENSIICNNNSKKLSYRRDSARCWNGHSSNALRGHSLLCQWTRHIWLNSNLTSIFNRSWNITPSLHGHTPTPLSSETGKRRLGVGGYILVSGCPAQKIGLFSHKLKSVLTCAVCSQCTPVSDRQKDREKVEHRGNTATIRFNERIAR